jgi:hypothetical protein
MVGELVVTVTTATVGPLVVVVVPVPVPVPVPVVPEVEVELALRSASELPPQAPSIKLQNRAVIDNTLRMLFLIP